MKRILILILTIVCMLYVGYSTEISPQAQIDNIPRPEYPRPQFVRSQWVNLNGKWTYTFDFGKSGKERDFSN
ncbi:MAG: beta-glucuronidase, partial [Acidobacteriota bacterium]|nr:beta-glucuronidase [Acidobacteriota bacterium]